MTLKITLSLDKSEYDQFTGGAIGVPITEKQAAILSSVFAYAYIRDAWQEMTDAEWDELSSELAEIGELLTP